MNSLSNASPGNLFSAPSVSNGSQVVYQEKQENALPESSDSVSISWQKSEPAEKKEWTVLCFSDSEETLEGSFTKNQTEYVASYSLKDAANFVIQFNGSRNGTGEVSGSRYLATPEHYSIRFDEISSKTTEDSPSQALENFLSWGIRQFPAQHYLFIVPGGITENGAEEANRDFYAGLPLRPADREALKTGEGGEEKTVLTMPGFDAVSLHSYEDRSGRNKGNFIHYITQSAYQMTGAAAPDKIEKNAEYEALSDWFKENKMENVFTEHVQAAQGEKILSREYTEKYGLSQTDLICLRHYTLNGYKSINRALRNDDKKELETLAPIIEQTLDGLQKLPSYCGPVYRNTNMPQEFLDAHKVGAEIRYNSFVSTSKFEKWNATEQFAGNTELIIDSSSKGKDVSWLSQYSNEDEILFPPDTEFIVLSHEEKEGKHFLHLREKADTL